MKPDRTTISTAQNYEQIGEFWDGHDLADHWDETRQAGLDVDLQSRTTYYAIDRQLSERLRATAARRGVSAETLVNLWVQEKIAAEAPVP